MLIWCFSYLYSSQIVLCVACVAFMNKIVAFGKEQSHHPDLVCCKTWAFETLGKKLSETQHTSFLLKDWLFWEEKEPSPKVVCLTCWRLWVDLSQWKGWQEKNGMRKEGLSSEVGGNQECVVLDSAVPLSSWDNGQVISFSGLSLSSPHPVLKERVQMGDKVKENGYCFNLKTLYFPLFILLRTWEFKYLGFS